MARDASTSRDRFGSWEPFSTAPIPGAYEPQPYTTTEEHMRKEDRIRQQVENEPARQPNKQPDKTQPPKEQLKGQQQSERPPRKPGALPIPD